MFNGKFQYKWWSSIVLLSYQRVTLLSQLGWWVAQPLQKKQVMCGGHYDHHGSGAAKLKSMDFTWGWGFTLSITRFFFDKHHATSINPELFWENTRILTSSMRFHTQKHQWKTVGPSIHGHRNCSISRVRWAKHPGHLHTQGQLVSCEAKAQLECLKSWRLRVQLMAHLDFSMPDFELDRVGLFNTANWKTSFFVLFG